MLSPLMGDSGVAVPTPQMEIALRNHGITMGLYDSALSKDKEKTLKTYTSPFSKSKETKAKRSAAKQQTIGLYLDTDSYSSSQAGFHKFFENRCYSADIDEDLDHSLSDFSVNFTPEEECRRQSSLQGRPPLYPSEDADTNNMDVLGQEQATRLSVSMAGTLTSESISIGDANEPKAAECQILRDEGPGVTEDSHSWKGMKKLNEDDEADRLTKHLSSASEEMLAPCNRKPVTLPEMIALLTLARPPVSIAGAGVGTSHVKTDGMNIEWINTIHSNPEAAETLALSKNLFSMRIPMVQMKSSYSPSPEVLDSPRSLLVCLRNGLSPDELSYRPHNVFRREGSLNSTPKEVVKQKYDHLQCQRKQCLELLREQYRYLCLHSAQCDYLKWFADLSRLERQGVLKWPQWKWEGCAEGSPPEENNFERRWKCMRNRMKSTLVGSGDFREKQCEVERKKLVALALRDEKRSEQLKKFQTEIDEARKKKAQLIHESARRKAEKRASQKQHDQELLDDLTAKNEKRELKLKQRKQMLIQDLRFKAEAALDKMRGKLCSAQGEKAQSLLALQEYLEFRESETTRKHDELRKLRREHIVIGRKEVAEKRMEAWKNTRSSLLESATLRHHHSVANLESKIQKTEELLEQKSRTICEMRRKSQATAVQKRTHAMRASQDFQAQTLRDSLEHWEKVECRQREMNAKRERETNIAREDAAERQMERRAFRDREESARSFRKLHSLGELSLKAHRAVQHTAEQQEMNRRAAHYAYDMRVYHDHRLEEMASDDRKVAKEVVFAQSNEIPIGSIVQYRIAKQLGLPKLNLPRKAKHHEMGPANQTREEKEVSNFTINPSCDDQQEDVILSD